MQKLKRCDDVMVNSSHQIGILPLHTVKVGDARLKMNASGLEGGSIPIKRSICCGKNDKSPHRDCQFYPQKDWLVTSWRL